jgi:NADPH-dependent 2,4-dienoyl-CoA reductase/sulfur reductase-like enzyme
METASSLRKRDLKVKVVSKDKIPFSNIFGEQIGSLILKEHEANGVEFILESEVRQFKGKGIVREVELINGNLLEADMVIIGIGVKPATDFIKGISKLEDGSIKVNKYLEAAKDVYGAGDLASFPENGDNKHIRIEHWRTAQQQGKVAALNMLGKKIPFDKVPFFWTNQVNLQLQYVGHAEDWDNIEIEGDLDEKNFLAYFIKGEKIKAVAASNRNKETAIIEELMRYDRMPPASEIPLDLGMFR